MCPPIGTPAGAVPLPALAESFDLCCPWAVDDRVVRFALTIVSKNAKGRERVALAGSVLLLHVTSRDGPLSFVSLPGERSTYHYDISRMRMTIYMSV